MPSFSVLQIKTSIKDKFCIFIVPQYLENTAPDKITS